jgi:hydroxyacylglutathione hydrolase
MYFEQFYLGCLAHASYMIASDGIAAVVDPRRDVEIYLEAAAEHGLKIAYIFETHLHADFVSGHRELAAQTGAEIYISGRAGAQFPHVPVYDGFELQFGAVRLNVVETPGHTPESVCLIATDLERSPDPFAVLTGDTLFIGDVGRPDLSKTHTPQQLAAMLYDSLHQKLLTLPDDVLVYPAHGAGSLCGRNMRDARYSTIGTERLTNYALQIGSKEEFIRQMTQNLPARPDYFLQDAEINRGGANPLAELPELREVDPQDVPAMQEAGTVVLDTRSPDQFAAGHVPRSLNVGLTGQFASWAGTVIGLATPVLLVAESPEQVGEARTRLARVGLENVAGFIRDGVAGWRAAGMPVAALPQISPKELHQRLAKDEVQVLDVRREPEWTAGHIAGAHWWPLDYFQHALPLLDPTEPVAVHCKSGFRSSIASSLLQHAGFKHVTNVVGGFDAWKEAGLPFVTAESEEAAVKQAG